MNIQNANFEISAVKPEQYPSSTIPEIAFLGRSNVGKSSFINALLNRKNIARISSSPGKTRTINFFNIDDKLYFVDLPGYGYATVSKTEKASWGVMIEKYLKSRGQLRLVCLLVDIRHKPSADDKLMYDWILSSNIPHVIIMTKSDKITHRQIKERTNEIQLFLELPENTAALAFSAETKFGRDDVWKKILMTLD